MFVGSCCGTLPHTPNSFSHYHQNIPHNMSRSQVNRWVTCKNMVPYKYTQFLTICWGKWYAPLRLQNLEYLAQLSSSLLVLSYCETFMLSVQSDYDSDSVPYCVLTSIQKYSFSSICLGQVTWPSVNEKNLALIRTQLSQLSTVLLPLSYVVWWNSLLHCLQ